MKRSRELEMRSEIRSAIDELSMVMVFPKVKPVFAAAAAAAAVTEPHHTTASSVIATKPFLSFFNLVLQVLDKIGPTMAVLRQDIHQNKQRLEKLYESDPCVYSNVLEILKKEGLEGKAKQGHSCSKAFVWLTRSLDFTVTLLQLLVEDFGRNLEEAVGEAYDLTLKPWHGWISSAAYKVALKLVPDTKGFINLLMPEAENEDVLKEELHTLISTCIPLLEEIHGILKEYGLNKLKCI